MLTHQPIRPELATRKYSFWLQAIAPHQALHFARSLQALGFVFDGLKFWGDVDGESFENGANVEAVAAEGDRLKINGEWVTPALGDYTVTVRPPGWITLL